MVSWKDDEDDDQDDDDDDYGDGDDDGDEDSHWMVIGGLGEGGAGSVGLHLLA